MKKLLIVLILVSFHNLLFSQRVGIVSGIISDQQTNEPLQGATVSLIGSPLSTTSDNKGYYIFPNISAGKVTLMVSYIGYQAIKLVFNVKSDNINTANIALNLIDQVGDQIVVTASKRSEKITNTPASIQVIGKKELAQFSGSNVFELYSKVQGIEFVRAGVDNIGINARGFNRAANNKVFQMVDGRNTMTTASVGLPLYNNASVNKEDIDRVEILLGPQAALYGPNVHNALFYTITKDPRKYQGTTVAVSAGNQNQYSARIRHAKKINNKWAYKVTGEYVTGKEFKFYDSVYAGGKNFGPEVVVPERNVDFDIRHVRGEAHLYYSLSPKVDIILTGGGSENSFLGVTNAGRNQGLGITTGFLQARIVNRNVFATVYNSWGNIGNTYAIMSYTKDYWNSTHDTTSGRLTPEEAEIYALRLGNRFKEQNQRLNAEAQYNYSFEKAGLFLVAGLSYQKDKPNSFGYSLLDKDNRIYVTQTGVVLQLEKSLPWDMRIIGAARFDNHSNLGNFFSPKIALTKQAGEQNFRITWGKSYSVPSIFFQYANSNGITFGNGSGIVYIPNGSDINGEPSITTPLLAEEINTWEIGYKGTIGKRLFIDFNCYSGRSENFLGPPLPVTGRALTVNGIPVTPANPGNVVNGILSDASFNTFFNYGNVWAYGADIGLNYTLNRFISIAVKYSWLDSDIRNGNMVNDANGDDKVLADEKSLNAPNHRALLFLNLNNLCRQKMFVSISARYTQVYDFYSGNQIGTKAGEGSRGMVGGIPKNFDWGPLGGFAILDLSAGYRINEMMNLNVGITNILNSNQREFVGSPFIGRLMMAELKIHVPAHSQK